MAEYASCPHCYGSGLIPMERADAELEEKLRVAADASANAKPGAAPIRPGGTVALHLKPEPAERAETITLHLKVREAGEKDS